jgi:hypothetical protein
MQPGCDLSELVGHAEAADLIVADSRPLSRYDEYRTADAARLMLGSGRPVLLTPPSAEALKGEAVVVAWKGA